MCTVCYILLVISDLLFVSVAINEKDTRFAESNKNQDIPCYGNEIVSQNTRHVGLGLIT